MDGSIPHSRAGSASLVSRGSYRPFGAFRLGLAMLVVLQHLQYLLPDGMRPVFHTMGFGALAVGVFFALSGFIVAEASDSFYAGRPGAFLVNRLLRVVPPYLAALAISAVVQALLWRSGRLALWDFVLQRDPLDPALLSAGVLSLLPGFHTRYVAQDFEYIPFVWTLRVEMAFYLAAVAVGCAMLWAPRWRRWLAPAAVAAGFAGFGLFLWRGGPGLLTDVPFFLLGVCLYGALRAGALQADAPRSAALRGGVLTAGARGTGALPRAGALLRGGPGGRGVYWAATLLAGGCALGAFGFWDQRGLPVLAAQLPVLALLLAAMAVLAAWPAVALRARRIDKRMGALSYPLYLNHYAVGIGLYDLVPGRGIGVYAVGIGASLALAWLMHRVVEVPMERLRTRVRGRAV